MIWADKLAILWAIVICVVLAVLQRPGHFDIEFYADVLLRLAVLPWVFLRLVHFMFLRRRS